MVKLEMLVDGLPDFGTDHTPLNYAAIAQAAGIHLVRIEQPAEVARRSPRRSHIPVRRWSTWSPSPTRCQYPRTSPRPQVMDFALAATKVVFNGGVGKYSKSRRTMCATFAGSAPSRRRSSVNHQTGHVR
jgi:pyruvate dehydrogenase (quinone)